MCSESSLELCMEPPSAQSLQKQLSSVYKISAFEISLKVFTSVMKMKLFFLLKAKFRPRYKKCVCTHAYTRLSAGDTWIHDLEI